MRNDTLLDFLGTSILLTVGMFIGGVIALNGIVAWVQIDAEPVTYMTYTEYSR